MKQRILNFILTLILITGLSLLLYPSVSNWWNAKHQSRAIASYSEAIEKANERGVALHFIESTEPDDVKNSITMLYTTKMQ